VGRSSDGANGFIEPIGGMRRRRELNAAFHIEEFTGPYPVTLEDA
jgi:hypothetical protein